MRGPMFLILAGSSRRRCRNVSAAFISTRARANSRLRGPTRGTNAVFKPIPNANRRRAGKASVDNVASNVSFIASRCFAVERPTTLSFTSLTDPRWQTGPLRKMPRKRKRSHLPAFKVLWITLRGLIVGFFRSSWRMPGRTNLARGSQANGLFHPRLARRSSGSSRPDCIGCHPKFR